MTRFEFLRGLVAFFAAHKTVKSIKGSTATTAMYEAPKEAIADRFSAPKPLGVKGIDLSCALSLKISKRISKKFAMPEPA